MKKLHLFLVISLGIGLFAAPALADPTGTGTQRGIPSPHSPPVSGTVHMNQAALDRGQAAIDSQKAAQERASARRDTKAAVEQQVLAQSDRARGDSRDAQTATEDAQRDRAAALAANLQATRLAAEARRLRRLAALSNMRFPKHVLHLVRR